MDNSVDSNAQEFLFFKSQWASWIEQSAQASHEIRGTFFIPEAYHYIINGEEGIAIRVGTDQNIRDLAQTIYGARPISHFNLMHNNRLSAADLLGRLPWQKAVGQSRSLSPNIPDRLIIRLFMKELGDFKQAWDSLVQEIYRINSRGIRHIITRAAVLQAPLDESVNIREDSSGYHALLFVARLSSQNLVEYLKKCANGYSFYQPYEVKPEVGLEEDPRGGWIRTDLEEHPPYWLPYLDSLSAALRQGLDSAVWLIEPSQNHLTSHIQRIEAAFRPLYYFGNFTLQGQAGAIETISARESVRLKPFTVKLDLRQDSDRSPRRQAELDSLKSSERQIQARLKELEREQRRISFLKRRVERATAQGPNYEVPSAAPAVIKNIYLFYEEHTGDPFWVSRWHALQEVLLNASLAELKRLQHAVCRFVLKPSSEKNKEVNVAFHLIASGSNQARPDYKIPSGLEDADLIFEQDVNWKEAGYSLYVPRGSYLYPPLRPEPPEEIPPEKLDDKDRQAYEERVQLFNDLLVKAVYSSGNRSLSQNDPAIQSASLLAPEIAANRICLIYPDPIVADRLPIFIRPEDWQTLDQAAAALINQVGLTSPGLTTEPVRDLVNTIDKQLSDALRVNIDQDSLVMERQKIEHSLEELLDKALNQREAEMDQLRLEKEAELLVKSQASARKLVELREGWKELREKIDKLVIEMRGTPAEQALSTNRRYTGKLGAVQKLLDILEKRSHNVDEIALETAQSWEEFVSQIIETTKAVEPGLDGQLAGVEERIKKADAKLQNLEADILKTLRPRLDQSSETTKKIAERTQGKTTRLAESQNLLARVQAMVAGEEIPALPEISVSKPAQDLDKPDPTLAINKYQDDLEAAQRERQAVIQQLQEIKANARLMEQGYQQEINELQERVALLDDLKRQMAEIEQEKRKGESGLVKEVKAREEEIRKLQKEFNKLNAKLQEANEEHNQDQNSLNELKRKVNDLSTKDQLIEDLQARIAGFEDGVNNLQNASARSWFMKNAHVVDDLLAAESNSSPATAAGLAMIRKKFYALFEQQYPQLKIMPIVPGETLFDAKYHLAVSTEEYPQFADEAIIQILKTGYLWNDQVLQYASVIINHLNSGSAESGSEKV